MEDKKISDLRFGLGIKIYPTAITQKRERYKSVLLSGSAVPRRGEIKSFSSRSRLRLRQILASSKLVGSPLGVFGVTLTLPWKEYESDKVNDDYKVVWNRFQTYFKRKFIYSSIVFRHELQLRGVPHSHAILYLSEKDCVSFENLQAILLSLWGAAFLWDFRGGSASGFARRGVVVERLENNQAMIRYITDHTSKKKKSQLGYKGRQWGIINKANLETIKPIEEEFDDDKMKIRFYRELSKVCRFDIKCDCVFGKKRSRRIKIYSRSVQFVKDTEILRLISALKNGIISV